MHNSTWGTIMGQPFGVVAYSNLGFVFDRDRIHEYQTYWPKEETGLARDVYIGFKYQCVEYARRFLTLKFKAAFTDIPHAHNMWALDIIEDCTKEEGTFPFVNYPNGSKEPPQFGDLIIYPYSKEQRFGHVGVIINVNLEEKYVDIGEQNYEEAGWECPEYARRLIMKIENGQYFITNKRIGKPYDNWDINEEIFGWKRIDFGQKQ
ncbi:unnamed protein product [Paramecium octaurelia]|uniref:Peptidase C51 domain-containing protein n=1 Tax=Paramecium octaurelia TaxID=43137 RepID=A0A8S1T136_PAROT|nr:unnamed protein product [Paramecium octaurelia]